MIDQRALELAYRYLNRRERTVSELRGHLLGRDIDEPVAAAVIEHLCEDGYLDDARFARVFAQDKRELEQWGDDRIRRELLNRGVERELIDAALDPALDEGQLTRAVALLNTRFPDPPRDRRNRERALGMLMRKGYAYEVASDALRAHAEG